jgi:hypothetical protein
MRLLEQAQAAADVIQRLPANARIRVVAKNDVDGVAAAAIALRAFLRAKRPFHISYEMEVNDEVVTTLRQDRDEAFLFLGLGHAFLLYLDRLPGAVVLIDTDRLSGPAPKRARLAHVNPGLDPSMPPDSASASSLTFALAVALDMANQDLAHVGVLGAFAKAQDQPALRSWNKDVYETAVARGLLSTQISLTLPEGPLIDAFAALPAAWKPAAHDLGDVGEYLTERGLAAEANVHELPRLDLELFASLLVARGLRRGVPPAELQRLFRSVARSSPHQGLPMPRLVNLIGAAAAQGEAGLAVQFLLGDTTLLSELERLETLHHEPHHRTAHGHPGAHHA